MCSDSNVSGSFVIPCGSLAVCVRHKRIMNAAFARSHSNYFDDKRIVNVTFCAAVLKYLTDTVINY